MGAKLGEVMWSTDFWPNDSVISAGSLVLFTGEEMFVGVKRANLVCQKVL